MEFKKTKKYEGITVFPEHIRYLSSPKRINQALKQTENHGFELYIQGEKIGFILLRQFSKEAYFLWDLVIDQKYQNKGYGTIILNELFELLKRDFNARLLTTTYIAGNNHAKYIYEKAGFVEMDRVQVSEVWEVNLKKEL